MDESEDLTSGPSGFEDTEVRENAVKAAWRIQHAVKHFATRWRVTNTRICSILKTEERKNDSAMEGAYT
ncbi:MAG: hypothetical protein ACI4MG_03350 [Aristaeellaceae bacterium]